MAKKSAEAAAKALKNQAYHEKVKAERKAARTAQKRKSRSPKTDAKMARQAQAAAPF